MTLKLLQMQWVLSLLNMNLYGIYIVFVFFFLSFFTTNGKFQSSFQSRNHVASVIALSKVLSFCMKIFFLIIINIHWIEQILLTNPKRIGHNFCRIDTSLLMIHTKLIINDKMIEDTAMQVIWLNLLHTTLILKCNAAYEK